LAVAAGLVGQCCLDERAEQRVAVTRGRLEFRVELHADIPWVRVVAGTRQFHDLAQVFVRGAGRNHQAGRFDLRQVVVVRFVAVTVALGHDAP
jgi:hypothetical protein